MAGTGAAPASPSATFDGCSPAFAPGSGSGGGNVHGAPPWMAEMDAKVLEAIARGYSGGGAPAQVVLLDREGKEIEGAYVASTAVLQVMADFAAAKECYSHYSTNFGYRVSARPRPLAAPPAPRAAVWPWG